MLQLKTLYKNQQKQIMKLTRLFMISAIFAAFLTSCEEEDSQKIIEGSISTNTTWSEGETYIIRGDVSVDNTTLTIQPGATIKFEAGASLSIGYYGSATLIANGTQEKPITFTSTLDSPTAGTWEGIYLYSYNSSNTSFKYCNIKYAGTDSDGALNIIGTSCSFSNNAIQFVKKLGIKLTDHSSLFVEMNNNTISDCGSHAIKITSAQLHTIGTGNTFTCTTGFGVNVYSDGDVTGTKTWKKLTVPYFIEGEIDIDGNLTIDPGTIFKFNGDGSLEFGYYATTTLTANGTALEPIVFTSSATTPSSGAWNGIYFFGYNQQNSSMTYCEIAYAGKSNGQAINLNGTKLTFNNNAIHHSLETAIKLSEGASFVSMNNNTVSNCGKHAIIMYAENFRTIGTGNTLSAATDMGIYLEGGRVTTSGTWRKQTLPVIINSEVDIDATLTIEAGSTFKFGGDGILWFGYYSNTLLNAIGTLANPIVFTAWTSSPAAGAWKGIVIDGYTSSNSTLDYCDVRYAGKGSESDRASVFIRGVSGMTIKNSKFSDSNGWGIYLNNSTLSDTSVGNTFTNCTSGNQGTN